MTRARDLSQTAGGTFAGDINVSNGTIKLDGNYPVGTDNVALGDTALDSNVSGVNNTAVGSKALTANTASDNTAVGTEAAAATTSGTANSIVGKRAFYTNTTGSNNSVLGAFSLFNNTSGGSNTAVGTSALQSNTTSSNSTAVGYQAGYSQTSAGGSNAFFGYLSGYSTTGGSNTFLGNTAGYYVSSGTKNTIVGQYNGNQGSLDIRTSSNNIVLSDGDGNPFVRVTSFSFNYQTGSATTVDASNPDGVSLVKYTGQGIVRIGNTATAGRNVAEFFNGNGQIGAILTSGTSTSYNTSSDYRLKENVVYDWDATTRLKQLKPARFNFIADADTTVDGFLAHEAQEIVPECVTGAKDAVDADGVAVMQGIDQSKLVPLLVKTIQELEARITALEAN